MRAASPSRCPTNEVDFLAIGERERSDEEAAFPPVRCHQALLLESVEGTAHGCTTQPQTIGNDALGDARARGKLPSHNDAAQLVIRAQDIVLALIALGEELGVGGLGEGGGGPTASVFRAWA